MRTITKVGCSVAAAVVFSVVQASAEILAWDVAGHGTPVDTTLSASTVQAGVLPTPALSRVNVNGTAAANAFNQNVWNNTATFLQNNNYVTFTLTVGNLDLGNTGITLDSLQFAINGSNTAPKNGRWGYELASAPGVWTTFDFTIANPTPSGFTGTWTIGGTPVAAGDSVAFRWWQFGTTPISGASAQLGGTSRIANIVGNDLVLNYTQVIPEPSTITLIGMGLVGLLAFARRRQS